MSKELEVATAICPVHGPACERIHEGDHVRVVVDCPWVDMTGVVTQVKGSTAEDMVVAFRIGYELKSLSFTESELEKVSA